MSSDLMQILDSRGPCLSSTLVQELIANGLSAEAARQRVSRASGCIKRLKGIGFPNKQQFLFIDKQFSTENFKARLANALEETRSAYGRAIRGLRIRGGTMQSSLFPIASGLPVSNAKRQLLHSLVMDRLIQVGLINRYPSTEGELISLWDTDGLQNRSRAVLLVENIVLAEVRSWLIKLGWSSTGTLKTRDSGSLPLFGQFAWDVSGPCYLSGIRAYKNREPVNGFIVGDIVLDRILSVTDLQPFISKWTSLEAQRRSTRFQPFIIAEEFEPDALNLLRSKGTLIFIPSVVLGQDLARDLKQIIGTIENAAAAVTKNPTELFNMLDRLSKVEGASLNLRGVVLEMIVAHLYKQNGYEIDIRQQIVMQGKQAEIDVKARNRAEVVCCECKGKAPQGLVNDTEIQEWLDEPLPRIKSWLKESKTLPEKRRFEFYSSTGYTPDGLRLIKHLKETHIKQPIEFYAGNDIVRRLRERKENQIVKIFNEHFVAG